MSGLSLRFSGAWLWASDVADVLASLFLDRVVDLQLTMGRLSLSGLVYALFWWDAAAPKSSSWLSLFSGVAAVRP